MIRANGANCRLLVHAVSKPRCGVPRGQKIFAKRLLGPSGDGTEIWHKLEKSPNKEEVALLRDSGSSHLAGTMFRRAMEAGIADDWSELLRCGELHPLTRVKLQECYHEAKQ